MGPWCRGTVDSTLSKPTGATGYHPLFMKTTMWAVIPFHHTHMGFLPDGVGASFEGALI